MLLILLFTSLGLLIASRASFTRFSSRLFGLAVPAVGSSPASPLARATKLLSPRKREYYNVSRPCVQLENSFLFLIYFYFFIKGLLRRTFVMLEMPYDYICSCLGTFVLTI